MPTFDRGAELTPGTVVKVPFPYTDRSPRQRRLALVVSTPSFHQRSQLCWVLMITSAANRGWVGDVEILHLGPAGFPAPSVVRSAKIATVETRNVAPLGRVEPDILTQIGRYLGAVLGAPNG
jgi:mRNA interferase MazF